MEPRKHRTPSGLPPSNFEEGADVWDSVKKSQNELELILTHGVWAPPSERIGSRRMSAAPNKPSADVGLFAANSPEIKPLHLISWWEKRRIAYNGVLLGFAALALCFLWLTTICFRYKMDGLPDALSRGDTLLDPYALAWLIVGANAVFTFAWCFDIATRKMLKRARHANQSASLLHASLWLSLTAAGLVSVSLLHFAIAH